MGVVDINDNFRGMLDTVGRICRERLIDTYMNESGGYNDPRAEVFGTKECPFWDTDPFVSRSVNGEPRAWVQISYIFPLKANLGYPPSKDPTRITKIEDTLRPMRPSKSLPVSHWPGETASAIAKGDCCEIILPLLLSLFLLL